MTFQERLVAFSKWFQGFRKTPWFRILYLVILGILVAELYILTASAAGCLILLLMPLSAFVVPYYLGERKPRRFAANGVPVFVLATILAAAMATQALISQDHAVPLRSLADSFSSPTMALSNGTVTPYHGSPGQNFTFRVKLTTTVDGNATAYAVWLNLTALRGLAPDPISFPMVPSASGGSGNTKNGTWYEWNVTLGDSIYGYGFSVTDRRFNWTFSAFDFGPITASGWAYYGFFLYYTTISMLIPLSFYYLILFMWWYSVRMRKSRTRMLETAEEAEAAAKEKPAAKTDFGSSKVSKASAFTCTNCGADVDESDTKCPKCGAVFED